VKKFLSALLLAAGLLNPAAALVPVMAPPAVAREAEKEAQFLASRKSSVYHRPSCRYVRQIKQENLIGFKTRQEAESAGYRACKVCQP
jgi:hypothetical protein